jgi:hypothetical protein
MALKNHSVFYYGHKIDSNNNLIPFKDGASVEKIAELPVGSYTLTKFVQTIVAALNAASSLDWDGSVDRATRIVTLTSSGPASLLFATGSTALNSPYLLLGFTASDLINQTSFVGSSGSGSEYRPQFPIQDYMGKDKNKKLVNAVSVQSFGVDRYIRGNIKFITNEPTAGILRNNPNAVEEVQNFMDYIIEKNPIEFMENENDVNTFDRVYLENTIDGMGGTSYELSEYFDRSLPGYYETGALTFRIINIE